ncbi:MAG TPA: hypothetical protein VIO94_10115 [Phenylobacterium sp.]
MHQINTTRRAALLGCAAAALAGPSFAATFPIKFIGFSGQQLKGGPVAIPAYQIAFFTSHQGTAVGGVLTKSRLTTTLAGVPEASMRKLVDEAYADLRSQLEAAGVPLVPEAETKAGVAASGLELHPNNAQIVTIGRGITIGASVKKGYVAYGASAAPAIKSLHNPGSPTGAAGLGAISINGKLGSVAKSHKAVVVAPSLVIDFAKTDAKGGRDFMGRESANVSNRLGFSLAGVSQSLLLSSTPDGRFVTPGIMRLQKDLPVDAPFATVETGAGAVRALSVASVTNSSYIDEDAARGDAAVVDLPVWEGLVRDAYRAFNAQLVAEFKKARG